MISALFLQNSLDGLCGGEETRRKDVYDFGRRIGEGGDRESGGTNG